MARVYLIEQIDKDFFTPSWKVSCPYDRTKTNRYFYFKFTALWWARKQQKHEHYHKKSTSFILNEHGKLTQGEEPF